MKKETSVHHKELKTYMKRQNKRQQYRQNIAMWEEVIIPLTAGMTCDIEAFHWQLASNPDKNNIVLQCTTHWVLRRYKQVKCTSLYCVSSKQHTVVF